MGFETLLNTVWLLLGMAAVAGTLRCALKSRSPILYCVGVGLVVTTLFPIISASDDLIRLQHFAQSHDSDKDQSTNDNQKRTSDNLVRLYEAMESPLAAAPVQISFTLLFAFLVVTFCSVASTPCASSQRGRSPPDLSQVA